MIPKKRPYRVPFQSSKIELVALLGGQIVVPTRLGKFAFAFNSRQDARILSAGATNGRFGLDAMMAPMRHGAGLLRVWVALSWVLIRHENRLAARTGVVPHRTRLFTMVA